VTARALPTLVALAALAWGCTDKRTEVIVVTDTNLRVPTAVDSFRLVVTDPGGGTKETLAMLGEGQPPLPRYVGLVHRNGPLGPYRVDVTARLGSTDVVGRSARFEFQKGRTLLLRLDLLSTCVGMSCGADQTCGPSGCRPVDVAPAELEEWRGPPSAGDAGCLDTEICNGVDDDCDGMVDEDFDLMSDPMNCGGCGVICDFRNATGSCQAGSCRITACNMGFEDCDMMGGNGCETDLNDPMSCGSCTNRCRNPDRLCCSMACARSCP